MICGEILFDPFFVASLLAFLVGGTFLALLYLPRPKQEVYAMPDPGAAPRYVCENCGRLGPIASFSDDCKPGWTHGRLIKVTAEVDNPVVAALEQAVETLDIATEVIAATELPRRAILSERLVTATRDLRAKVAAAIETPIDEGSG